jgi:uncharacterized protein (TIGR00299 family) protein
MKTAYFDCASGISGDMTLAALVDAGADLAAIQAGIDSLGLAACRLVPREVKKKGFRALQVVVEHPVEHAHRHLHHITAMIEASRLTPCQQQLATRIFTRLGEAEAKVHGVGIRQVHFHEVGAVDSIADIVGSAIALDLLGIERVVCSPLPTGQGFVTIAHGRCSIPAPATAELLKGVPLAASSVECELTTPTGAAIATALAQSFGPLPAMWIETIGYGAGSRDLDEQPNLLRVLVGQSEAGPAPTDETLWMVQTNLDDASGEVIGHCTALLWEAGALDVFCTGVQMKKNRPGQTLSVLCHGPNVERIEGILFRETTTLGVRRWAVQRRKLPRQPLQVATPWGAVEGIVAQLPDGQTRFSPEYESCRDLAIQKGLALREVIDAAVRAFEAQHKPPFEAPQA